MQDFNSLFEAFLYWESNATERSFLIHYIKKKKYIKMFLPVLGKEVELFCKILKLKYKKKKRKRNFLNKILFHVSK